MNETVRLGLIDVSDVVWSQCSEQIQESLKRDGAEIRGILQALGEGGRYRAAKTIILVHPDFDEVDGSRETFRRYQCRFFVEPDGSVSHTEIMPL